MATTWDIWRWYEFQIFSRPEFIFSALKPQLGCFQVQWETRFLRDHFSSMRNLSAEKHPLLSEVRGFYLAMLEDISVPILKVKIILI